MASVMKLREDWDPDKHYGVMNPNGVCVTRIKRSVLFCTSIYLQWNLTNPIRKSKCIVNAHLCTEIMSDRDNPGLNASHEAGSTV